jgi:hypothetical protein
VKRLLGAAFALVLLAGAAMAQPPVDYALACDDVMIGVATVVDGRLEVALIEGAWCAEDATLLAVPVSGDADAIEVQLGFDDGAITVWFEVFDELVAVAKELPRQAVEGMANAHRLRAAAFVRRAPGGDEPTDLASPALTEPFGVTADDDRPVELPEAADRARQPELPEAATNREGRPEVELPEPAGANRRP